MSISQHTDPQHKTHIIAVANQKGGCGKTTTAINLAASLAQKGFRTLLVDTDPQGHASLGLGERRQDEPGLYEIFALDFPLAEAIIPNIADKLDIVPATISLAAVEHVLANLPERERQLAKHLEGVASVYDYVIIDCPPALGLLSINAIRAAERIVVPVDMGLFSVDGIERLSEIVELVEDKYDLDIQINILPTLMDRRTRLSRKFLLGIWERYQDKVLPVMIHHTVRLKEAVFAGRSIVDFDPRSSAADDYGQLADEIIRRSSDGLALIDAQQSWLLDHVKQAAPTVQKTPPSPTQDAGLQEVVLSYALPQTQNLQIAGDFNDWEPDGGVRTVRSNGLIHKVFYASPGDHQYRLIVDGKWRNDPTNTRLVQNALGTHNSVLHVAANGRRQAVPRANPTQVENYAQL